ncbi:hypothetical protein WJX73_006970 [Symbiochloris irregularis]|uniref:CDP-diacylglycerol--inositol 3-phosphatidyltransferase n=1 Tax=Symbiochloris irregularis TaxID=706552 RepID=A0AAW1NYW5_9CHLO
MNSRKGQVGFFSKHHNIYLYVPNLIGYARIAFSLYAFAVALVSPRLCVVFYFLGFVCDDLDGRFARLLNQTSSLGVVLDMVTDRLATAGLLTILCMLYPSWYTLFLGLLMLDVGSHWLQMQATLVSGATSHKDKESRSFLVRVYYQRRLFMGVCCICCEVLYLALYLLHWPDRFWSRPLYALPASLQPHLHSLLRGDSVSPAALIAAAACTAQALCKGGAQLPGN